MEHGQQDIFDFFLDDFRRHKIKEGNYDDLVGTAIYYKEWRMVERLKECGFVRAWWNLLKEHEHPDLTELGPKYANKMC
jgi:hypothetical protein